MTRRNQKYVSTTTVALERLPVVLHRTGLSSSEIYRRIAAGTFPRPLKLGPRASAWDCREVDAWIEARLEERQAAGGADR